MRDEPFTSNAIRLGLREWLITAALVLMVVNVVPPLWPLIEPIEEHVDYRVPYDLSKDYWLYEKHLGRSEGTFVLGDSVVWGEYVSRDGTLTHFLNELAGNASTYVNAGVNGLFPLALDGLVANHGKRLSGADIILHCNLLWTSGPEADLSIPKETVFNHVALVPQFHPRIPCYRANLETRLGHVLEKRVDILSWVAHLQQVYFDGLSAPEWTVADSGDYPALYPNTFANPFATGLEIPVEPSIDGDRGPASNRHRPWFERGLKPQSFEWVPLDESLQWAAFRRLVRLLLDRENSLTIVVGPFNSHILSPAGRPGFKANRADALAWLRNLAGVKIIVPNTLPSELYGDASHPLTDGYRRIAREILESRGSPISD
jgi:hypothetical protein